MRKLKPLEIFTLTTMMSLGSYADAQEAEEVLPTTSLGKITAHGGHTQSLKSLHGHRCPSTIS
jgi:hypothetical protein